MYKKKFQAASQLKAFQAEMPDEIPKINEVRFSIVKLTYFKKTRIPKLETSPNISHLRRISIFISVQPSAL